MRNLLVILFLATVLFGCGPKVNTIPHSQAPVITPDADSAVVYVMRQWSFTAGGRNYPVFEDGFVIGALATDTYFTHRTTPGKHFYHMDELFVGTYVEMQAGKVYYITSDAAQGAGMKMQEIPEVAAKQLLPKLKHATPGK